jgi:hypothetical protein
MEITVKDVKKVLNKEKENLLFDADAEIAIKVTVKLTEEERRIIGMRYEVKTGKGYETDDITINYEIVKEETKTDGWRH